MNHESREGMASPARTGQGGHRSRTGHWLMMIACCIPMLAIVAALWFTGIVGSGFIVAALVCVAMMPLLHGSMGHDHDKEPGERR